LGPVRNLRERIARQADEGIVNRQFSATHPDFDHEPVDLIIALAMIASCGKSLNVTEN